MGYEIAGGWGAKMADPSRDVIVMVGDGSYLMMNSDIYCSVLTGHKLIVVRLRQWRLCRHRPAAARQGLPSFNNQLADTRIENLVRVDFAKHAESMGAIAVTVHSIGELEDAFRRAKQADRTTVIVIKVQPHHWTPGDAWWEWACPR